MASSTSRTSRATAARRPRSGAKATKAKRPAAGKPRAKRAAAEPAAPAAGARALVVVESPTKSRTITKFLGRGFTVLASNGHVMDLPRGELGVDLEHDFEPTYVPVPSKTRALAKIRAAARTAEHIYLAPDPDRSARLLRMHG